MATYWLQNNCKLPMVHRRPYVTYAVPTSSYNRLQYNIKYEREREVGSLVLHVSHLGAMDGWSCRSSIVVIREKVYSTKICYSSRVSHFLFVSLWYTKQRKIGKMVPLEKEKTRCATKKRSHPISKVKVSIQSHNSVRTARWYKPIGENVLIIITAKKNTRSSSFIASNSFNDTTTSKKTGGRKCKCGRCWLLHVMVSVGKRERERERERKGI